MKRVKQLEINSICIDNFYDAYEQLILQNLEKRRKFGKFGEFGEFEKFGKYGKFKKLRTCHAYVYETDDYYFLRSYETFIACISKEKNICYDLLRIRYGFTRTSAYHISKFINDYGTFNKEEPTKHYIAKFI